MNLTSSVCEDTIKDQKVTVKFGNYTCEYTATCGSYPIVGPPDTTEYIFRQCFHEFMHKVFKDHSKDYRLRDLMYELLASQDSQINDIGDKLRGIMND